jgi:hypothetical protein
MHHRRLFDMQQTHIIHSDIALHKIQIWRYGAVIGSEMVRPGNQGAA